MTTTYTFQATVTIRVEADDAAEARQSAEDIAAEIEGVLPTGAVLVQHDGHAWVGKIS